MLKLVRHIATIARIDADPYVPLLRYQLCQDGQAATDDLDPSFLKLEANTWRLVMDLYKSVLSVQLLGNGAQVQALHFVCIELNFCGLIARPIGTSCALKDFLRRDKAFCCRVTTARASYAI